MRTQPENTDQEESTVDISSNERKTGRSKENSLDIEEVTGEGVKIVVNFLKDKIPDLKVKFVCSNMSKHMFSTNILLLIVHWYTMVCD